MNIYFIFFFAACSTTPSINPTFARIRFSLACVFFSLFSCVVTFICNSYISMNGRMCHLSDFIWNVDEWIISALMLPKIVLTQRKKKTRYMTQTSYRHTHRYTHKILALLCFNAKKRRCLNIHLKYFADLFVRHAQHSVCIFTHSFVII